MIIKSKSIKSVRNLSNVLRYILVGHNITDKGFVMSRFVSGDRKYHKELIASGHDTELQESVLQARIDNMFAKYRQNNMGRLVPHARGNVAYHEIISFAEGDTVNLSKEAMLKVARLYAKERSPNSLVVATMHQDRSHWHIHLVVSAVELDGKVKRLSKAEFRDIKQKLEHYQDRHLKLEHSRVNHSKKKHRHF